VRILINSSRAPQPQPFANIKSIAVLPFKPLIAESRDESLEMGMADTLIARLSNIRDINVRPISAVRKYAGLEQDAVAAGREQKVDAVVDGQIQKVGEKIRVTVRLVRVEDGAPLWASRFDEKMTDIFTIQDSISELVAGVLAVKLSGEEKERLTKHYTESAEAHQLYLMGRYHLNRLTDDGFAKSLEYFQQAIEKDSNFALAYTGMAESYNMLGNFNVLRPREVFPKARSAAMMALKLDDLLAEAHTALAVVKLTYDWDWSGAEREFKRAIELNPSDSEAHFEYGFHLTVMGHFDEAIVEMRRAQELDPVSLVKITGLAQVLSMARRYDETIQLCGNALEMDPNLGFAHWLLGFAYMWKGMYEPAIVAFQKAIPLSGDSPDEPAALGLAYALSGKSGEARKILDELKQRSKRKYLSPAVIATLQAALGEKDQAFASLDKAYDERDNLLVLLKVEPIFDNLRSDQRFADLLRRVGFAQ
jgi:serine/threonine-protein kinase